MRSLTARRRLAAVLALLGVLAAAPAAAQDHWPSRPLRLIVPFPAGSFTDTVARTVADGLAKGLGQPVVVDNKAGANGVLGATEAARAAPDGYTLMVTNSSSVTINPQIYRKTAYKAADFTPVTMVLEAPFVLAANAEWAQKNGIGTVAQLVDHMRHHPGQLSYGSAGPGNIAHLSFALLGNRSSTKATHIPYKSAAAAQLALLSGELHASFDTLTAVPHIQSGRLKALAVTSTRRAPQLPEVPTMEQAGYPDLSVSFWIGLLVPAGTPGAIVQRLHAATAAALDDPRARATLAAQGDLVLLEPGAYGRRVEREVASWGAVIQREGITLD